MSLNCLFHSNNNYLHFSFCVFICSVGKVGYQMIPLEVIFLTEGT